MQPEKTNEAGHPFLIVNSGQYTNLQAKASENPWKNWKVSAINNINTLEYDPSEDIRTKSFRMRDIVSAGALAYILDPSNRTSYENKLVTALYYWDDLLNTAKQANSNANCVYPGTAFFESVLALDIIYNDLTASERASIENRLQNVFTVTNTEGKNWLDACQWKQNTYAVKGIWALYTGNTTSLDSAKANYRKYLDLSLSSSGVYVEGGAYAGTRMSHPDKETKGHFLDVLEFTGADNNYYSDPELINFFEWLYGYSITPNRKQYYIFGDASPSASHVYVSGAAPFRAYRFSSKSAQYAAWTLSGRTVNGSLLNYILADQPLPVPVEPESRIFRDGGAWFLDISSSNQSLGGALWNARKSAYHSHYEVNALALAAYGETVLRNIGSAYGRSGTIKISDDKRRNNAEWGNTVLINNDNHISGAGGGIVEGFTAPLFDYASGDSAGALPNGKHTRNFVFVHPQDGKNGYWIIFDEIALNTAGDPVNVALHPNSDNYTVVADKAEYKWKMNHDLVDSGSHVYLTVFLGTEPASVAIKDGVMASSIYLNFYSKYIYSTYDTGSGIKKNIVTVLFPHDPTHPKASMSRIDGTVYSGASIDIGGSVIDTALESQGESKLTHGNVSFQGKAIWYRTNGGDLTSYFVRGGKNFDDGKPARQGFESNINASLYFNDMAGIITAPSADQMTFYYPGLASIKIDNASAAVISSGSGWMKISVPEGIHTITFNRAGALSTSPPFS